MKILWQSKSPVVYASFQEGRSQTAINGGNAYDVQSALVLSEKFNLAMDSFAVRKNESVFSYWRRMSSHKANADLLIMEPFPLVYGKRMPDQKAIAVIHHIDHSLAKGGLYHRWYFNRLLKRVKKCEAVITVSEHWKNYFLDNGCRNVKVIYNSFNISLYEQQVNDEKEFRKKLGLPEGKEIIYIGNAIREKGVYEVYDALKNTDYHLVMSGMANRTPDLNVQYLRLTRAEYLKLLSISSVVIAYSLVEEGWNRIAHEALLSHTPVIGTGTGGMSELLSKAKQIRVNSKDELREAVTTVLSDRKRFAEDGFSYVKQFDEKYFSACWENIIKSFSGKN